VVNGMMSRITEELGLHGLRKFRTYDYVSGMTPTLHCYILCI